MTQLGSDHWSCVLAAISCRLLYQSASPHIQQLFTGFRLLQRSGFLRLSQQRRRTPVRYDSDAPHLRDAGHAHLDALIDGKLRLHFDTHDCRGTGAGRAAQLRLLFQTLLPAGRCQLVAGGSSAARSGRSD